MSEPEPFDQSYWTTDSQYRKYEDYEAALSALRNWYQGLFRLIDSDLPEPGRVLDAGCGHGAIVHEFLARGWDAHGFDVSDWLIEQARAFSPTTAERFQVGELPAVPIQGPFDLITSVEVLEHVPEPLAVLRAFYSHLRPGGRLIATTPNLRPLIPWWDPETSDPTHVSVHASGWWREALESVGFDVRTVTTFVAVPVLWRAHPSFARWIRVGRRAGPGILMIADRQPPDAE